jgi:hypothetical protein
VQAAGCAEDTLAVMNLVLEMQNVRTVAAPITAVCGSCEVLSKPKVVLMTM